MIGKVFVPPSFLNNEWQSSSPNVPLAGKLHNDAHNDHPLHGSPRLKQKHAQTRACLSHLAGKVAVYTVSAGFKPAAEVLAPALTWQASRIRLSLITALIVNRQSKIVNCLRREWDSNPRWLAPRRFSRPLPSAARSSLRARRFYHDFQSLPPENYTHRQHKRNSCAASLTFCVLCFTL